MKLRTLTRSITSEKIARYSGAGNIHTDEEAARRIGIEGLIVQGGQLAGYLNDMLCESLGRGFIEGGEMSVTFIKSARAGDTVTTHGELTSRTVVGGRNVAEFEIWLENQHGDKLTVGTARAFLEA